MKLKVKAETTRIVEVTPAFFPEICEGHALADAPDLGARNEALLLAISHGTDADALASGLAAVFQNGPLETSDRHVRDALDRALTKVAQVDRPDVVRDLLARGANARVAGDAPLRIAVEKGLDDAVLVLLEYGADVHLDSDAALRQAVARGRGVEFVRALLEKGADVHADADQPLRDAVTMGRLDVVAALLEKGADVNANEGQPLRDAVTMGRLDIVEALLERGVDVHVNADQPLRDAVNMGYLDIVMALVDKGADVSEIEWKIGEARTWTGTMLQVRFRVLERSGELVPIETRTALTSSCLQGASRRGNLQDAKAILAAIDAMKLNSLAIAKDSIFPATLACQDPIERIQEGGKQILEILNNISSLG